MRWSRAGKHRATHQRSAGLYPRRPPSKAAFLVEENTACNLSLGSDLAHTARLQIPERDTAAKASDKHPRRLEGMRDEKP